MYLDALYSFVESHLIGLVAWLIATGLTMMLVLSAATAVQDARDAARSADVPMVEKASSSMVWQETDRRHASKR